jgi:hypothetical protein
MAQKKDMKNVKTHEDHEGQFFLHVLHALHGLHVFPFGKILDTLEIAFDLAPREPQHHRTPVRAHG